jgi:hypothetical protein
VRQGDILFYREADLAPGRYSLEVVGYDAMAEKAGTSAATLDVPRPEEGRPCLSSVVLVGRAEKVTSAEQESGNPLFYGETVLYPNMGEPFRKSASPALGFFFTVYGVNGAAGAAKAMIEVYRGGKPAGQVIQPLPAPDSTGRIQYAGALPLSSFPAGS